MYLLCNNIFLSSEHLSCISQYFPVDFETSLSIWCCWLVMPEIYFFCSSRCNSYFWRAFTFSNSWESVLLKKGSSLFTCNYHSFNDHKMGRAVNRSYNYQLFGWNTSSTLIWINFLQLESRHKPSKNTAWKP